MALGLFSVICTTIRMFYFYRKMTESYDITCKFYIKVMNNHHEALVLP